MTTFRERAADAFLADLERSPSVQEAYLFDRVIRPNVETDFGRRHGFGRIRTVADFRSSVPIRDFEGFRPEVDRILAGEPGVLTAAPVKRFFVTSGSMSKPKHIPVTQALIRDKSRAFGVYWSLVFRDHPKVKIGRIVTNFSDAGRSTTTVLGVPISSESAFWAGATRATQRQAPLIPKDVARIEDADARYRAIARCLLQARFSAVMALNPSTLYLLFHKLNEHAETLLDELPTVRAKALRSLLEEGSLPAARVWPDLSVAICWRSRPLLPYLRLLDAHLEGIPRRDYITMASEGVMAVPLADGGSGGALAVGVHFFELIPAEQHGSDDPEVLLPHEVEIGRDYALVLTTASGLYRYDIGDVVRVNGFFGNTPVVEFLHRAGRTSSMSGEKLTEAQVTAAVVEAAEETGVPLVSFTLFPADEGLPRYRLLVESREERRNLPALLAAFETRLCAHNSEYASKRSSLRLGAPELWVAAPGSFDADRRRRVESGAADEQVKPIHLSRDPRFADGFEVRERICED